MPNKTGRYELTPLALGDLDDIWLYSAETWSPEQADIYIDGLTQTFETLAAMPELARERPEFSPPVRIHPHVRHLIIYIVTPEAVSIIRILGGRQDSRAILENLDT